MNHERIAAYRRFLNEVDATIDARLQSMSAFDIGLAAKEAVDDPAKTIVRCLTSNAFMESAATMIAATLIRVALRKAEADEMEKGQ